MPGSVAGSCLAMALALIATLATPVVAATAPADRLAPYAYEDTKKLVTLVEDAAALVEEKGEGAFADFAVKGSRWFNDQYYFFVYTLDGTSVFHPISPQLVGKNLMDLRDLNGKPVIRLITDIGQRPEKDASGWVFYLWEEQTQLSPLWKSAYVRKAVAPDGKVYLVGSGVYNIKMEKPFVVERVTMAADLIRAKGKDAFAELKDPASPYIFLDTYVFVLDAHGHTLVDPAFPTLAGRDLSELEDAVGFYPIKELLAKLAESDEAWVQFLWPKPGSAVPSRKLVYARKVKLGDETLIVGSDFFQPTPIWMKVEESAAWPRNPPA